MDSVESYTLKTQQVIWYFESVGGKRKKKKTKGSFIHKLKGSIQYANEQLLCTFIYTPEGVTIVFFSALSKGTGEEERDLEFTLSFCFPVPQVNPS